MRCRKGTRRDAQCGRIAYATPSEGKQAASKSGSFKNGQEWGKNCFEDLDQRRTGRPATRTWSTDFLLREGSSREEIGKWLKKKVRTMATAEKIASGGDWYISLWTDSRCKSMGTEKRRRACCVRKRMRSVEAAGTESCRRRRSATFRARGALDKRRWSQPRTMLASGRCYKKPAWEGG